MVGRVELHRQVRYFLKLKLLQSYILSTLKSIYETVGCGKLMAYLAMFGYYLKKAYLKCYSSMIHPLPENSKWPHIEVKEISVPNV